MRLLTGVLISAVLLVGACSRPLGPAERRLAAATFELAEINGQPLPINRGPLTDRAGRRSGCDRMLDQGRLSLDPERERYDLHYLVRSSCDGWILDDAGAVGNYTQTGSTLVFEIPSIDRPRQFQGTVTAREITVVFYDQRMVFRLAGSASVLPMSGRFSHRAVPGARSMGDSAAAAGGCHTVDSVSLLLAPEFSVRTIFAPATGHFSLQREFRNSCTGQVTHRYPEHGSYEQIARAIYFEAYPAPRTVRRFRGVVLSNTEIDVLAGGGLPQRFSRLVRQDETTQPTQPVRPTDIVLSGFATDCFQDSRIRVPTVAVAAFDPSKNRTMVELLRTMDTVTYGGDDPNRLDHFLSLYSQVVHFVSTSPALARDTSKALGAFTLKVTPMDSVLVFGFLEPEDEPYYYGYAMAGGRTNAELELDMSRGGCDYLNR